MTDYTFAEAIAEAAPRIQAAFGPMLQSIIDVAHNIADWWDGERDAYLAIYDDLDVATKIRVNQLEDIWRSVKEARP